MAEEKKSPYTTGTIIFGVLMVLTIIEFFIGSVENPSTVLLLLLAIAKAGLIMNYFMHIYRLWRAEDHH